MSKLLKQEARAVLRERLRNFRGMRSYALAIPDSEQAKESVDMYRDNLLEAIADVLLILVED